VAQDFDLMYEQTKALKEGKPVQKPIYNHVSGKLDPAEEIKAPKVGPLSGLLHGCGTRLLAPLRVLDRGTSQLIRPAKPGHLRLLRALECSSSLSPSVKSMLKYGVVDIPRPPDWQQ
jgi:Phosphoribulokinase / Uridine kinase family